MKTFSLNDDWTVEYFEPDIDGFEMAPSPQPVPTLPAWRCSPRFAQAGFYAWLQRRFALQPTGYCVRYVIDIESAPPTTQVYVNDQRVASGEAPRADITDYVALGENRLNLRVDCAADGDCAIGAVRLLQIPCDEAH